MFSAILLSCFSLLKSSIFSSVLGLSVSISDANGIEPIVFVSSLASDSKALYIFFKSGLMFGNLMFNSLRSTWVSPSILVTIAM